MNLQPWDGLLIAARWLQFTAALVLFGSACFSLYGNETAATTGGAAAVDRYRPRLILTAAAAAVLIGTVLWVIAETALIGDSSADAADPVKLWTVLWDTGFGRVCLVRIGLAVTALALMALPFRRRMTFAPQAVLGAGVLVSFAWTGHGSLNSGGAGALHLGADLLHLLAAGLWFGALPPLALLAARANRSARPADARAARFALQRFSAIGAGIVGVLVLSGIVNSWYLIGPANWRALFVTAYGITLLLKLALFAAMLALAANHRWRLTPALAAYQGGDSAPPRDANQAGDSAASGALRRLHTGLALETLLAILVVAAVSVLGSLPPPIAL
jgi:putative copper resistance protein D